MSIRRASTSERALRIRNQQAGRRRTTAQGAGDFPNKRWSTVSRTRAGSSKCSSCPSKARALVDALWISRARRRHATPSGALPFTSTARRPGSVGRWTIPTGRRSGTERKAFGADGNVDIAGHQRAGRAGGGRSPSSGRPFGRDPDQPRGVEHGSVLAGREWLRPYIE